MSTHHDAVLQGAALAEGTARARRDGLATGQASAANTTRSRRARSLNGDGASDSILLAPDPTTPPW